MNSLAIMAAACGPQMALACALLIARYIAKRRRTSYSLVKERSRPK